MLHAETPHGSAVVGADAFLFGVEAHSLPDYGGLRAGRAPDGVGHFKADGEDSLCGLICAVSQRFFAVKGISACGSFEFGGHIAAHIEALHFGAEAPGFVGESVLYQVNVVAPEAGGSQLYAVIPNA